MDEEREPGKIIREKRKLWAFLIKKKKQYMLESLRIK